MDRDTIIEHLKRRAKFSEVGEVRTFRGYRESERGLQEIVVQILDNGSDLGDLRYHVLATEVVEPDEPPLMAAGNPAASVTLALDNVHWWDFDD